MIKKNLKALLFCLSTKESKRLRLFIKSPYFNSRPKLLHLFDAVKLHLDEHAKLPSKIIMYQTLFPDETFNEKKLGYHLGYLVQIIQEFLTQEAYKDQEIKHKLSELDLYHNRELDSAFHAVRKKIEKKVSQSSKQDALHFFHRFQLEHIKNSFAEKSKNFSGEESLQKAADALDTFYIANKLRYCCAMINSQNWRSSQDQIRFLNELLLYLDEHPQEQVPIISIYHNILNSLLYPDDQQHFENFFQTLLKEQNKFEHAEANEMFTYAINYCIQKINRAQSNYYKKLFEIYKEILPKGFLLDSGQLSPWSFNTIVSVAAKLKEYRWAENFIADYKEKIRKAFRKNAVNYNLAYLHFERKEYSAALRSLNVVEFKDSYYALNTKSMQLKLFYELNEIETLHSLVDSFRVFIRRNKSIAESLKTSYLNLNRFTKRLAKYSRHEKDKLQKLEQTIQETKLVAGRQWILEKLAEKSGILAQHA